ncbi:class I tRNA ligase family protein [Streptomyces sp. YC504]|uniref:Class I tRNA ligase family protein n=1 Tax=Streptomyces mesophilus TaxID=1775132 RepID=A0A6G4XGE5_9ACTN|nr:class I tRNA ligase family protein [Streptomyces mesophilus]NGO76252.1 class I tRNA ligase family protein [Streptomyces mesophilus]
MSTHAMSYVITSGPAVSAAGPHPGQSSALLGADVLERHLRRSGHRVRHAGHGTAPRPERVQRLFRLLAEAGAWQEREVTVFRCGPCSRFLQETEVRGRCWSCAARCDGMSCPACGRPQDANGLTAPRCAACGAAPTRIQRRRLVLPLEERRAHLGTHPGERRPPALRRYLSEVVSGTLPAVPVSCEGVQGIPVPSAGWEGQVIADWFGELAGYAEAVGESEVSGGPAQVVDFAGPGRAFLHAVLRPALASVNTPDTAEHPLPQGALTPHLIVDETVPPPASPSTETTPPNTDALRFHLCLTGSVPERSAAFEREYAETVSTVLAHGLDAWTDTVLDLLAEDFGSVVPGAAPHGPPAAERRELVRRTRKALAAETFSPQEAAEALATTVDRAVADLRQLRLLGGTELRSAYEARLVAHAELLAACAVTAAPLMPDWSVFLAGHLGIPLDEESGIPPWSAAETDRLVPPGTKLPESVPVYFHERP